MLIIFWKTNLKAVVSFGECAQSIRTKLSKILEYAQNVFVSCMAHKRALISREGDEILFSTLSHFCATQIRDWSQSTQCSVLGVYGMPPWKTLDNNDLNQVGCPTVLLKTRVWVGCLVLRAHKTWSQSVLIKDFLPPMPKIEIPF